MNCPNCGKKIKDDSSFCTSCGYSTDSESSKPSNKEPSNSSNKKAAGVAIGCFFAVVAIVAVVIIAIILFVSNIIKGISEKEEFVFGNLSVPSVYKLMGKQDICSYSSSISGGNNEYEIDYCKTSDKDLNKYIDTLISDYGFKELEETTFNREIIKEEKNGNRKVIHVTIMDTVITYRVE